MGGCGWSMPRPGRFTPQERPGTHHTGSWVGLRAGLGGCGKSRPIEIRSPDRPDRSESLYRLSYPGPYIFNVLYVNVNKRLCLTATRFDIYTGHLRVTVKRNEVFAYLLYLYEYVSCWWCGVCTGLCFLLVMWRVHWIVFPVGDVACALDCVACWWCGVCNGLCWLLVMWRV